MVVIRHLPPRSRASRHRFKFLVPPAWCVSVSKLYFERFMSRTPVAPFLISKDEQGMFRITVRATRLNSQNYPLVTSSLQPELFKSAMAARAHPKREFAAETGQFASK